MCLIERNEIRPSLQVSYHVTTLSSELPDLPLELQNTLLSSLLCRLSLNNVDVRLLSNTNLLSDRTDRRRLALHKGAESEVVETTVSQAVSVILGSLHTGNKVPLCKTSKQLVHLSAGDAGQLRDQGSRNNLMVLRADLSLKESVASSQASTHS